MENCILVKKENNQFYLSYKSLKVEATIGKNGLILRILFVQIHLKTKEIILGLGRQIWESIFLKRICKLYQ